MPGSDLCIGQHRVVVKNPDWEALFVEYTVPYFDALFEDPDEEAMELARLADEAPDDDHITALAVSLVEGFLHRGLPSPFHVAEQRVFPAFEAALRRSPNLRRAWCRALCTLPAEWEDRFNALVEPDEQISP